MHTNTEVATGEVVAVFDTYDDAIALRIWKDWETSNVQGGILADVRLTTTQAWTIIAALKAAIDAVEPEPEPEECTICSGGHSTEWHGFRFA